MNIARTRKISAVSDAVHPVTLERARAQCRVDCLDEDVLIGSYIFAATQAASDRLQRALVPANYRLTLDAFATSIELLPPVISVESVKYIDPDGAWQTLDPQSYLLDTVSEPGCLVPSAGCGWPATQDRINAVEVKFSAGYPENAVPEPIVQWILLVVADLYDNRQRSSERPVVPQNFADCLLDTYRLWSL